MSGRTAEASREENARRHRDHGGAGRGLLRSFSPIANRMITFPSREDLYSDHDRLSIRRIGKLPMARHNGRVICPVNPGPSEGLADVGKMRRVRRRSFRRGRVLR